MVGKRVYCKIIFCSWCGSFILASVFVILEINEPVACRGAWVSYTFVTVTLLTAAYVIILSKVLNKPYAQRFSSVILVERKLSITLLIVSLYSYSSSMGNNKLCFSTFRLLEDSIITIHKCYNLYTCDLLPKLGLESTHLCH